MYILKLQNLNDKEMMYFEFSKNNKEVFIAPLWSNNVTLKTITKILQGKICDWNINDKILEH